MVGCWIYRVQPYCRDSTTLTTRERSRSLVIGLGLHVFGSRESAAPLRYLAYLVGPQVLAIGVHELKSQNDEAALSEAIPLFHDGLKRVEVWCGSRKVGDIPPKSDEKSNGEPIRNSA
jgi:hypothetical protein